MSRAGLVAILMAVLSAGAAYAEDGMTMVQPAEYFKARNIEPTVDRLIDFAIAEIDTPKAQIRQLAALQYLTMESEKFKKAANYDTNRLAIEELAEGKRGKDPAGFGQQYAKRLLAKLDGAKAVLLKHRPLRVDALDWFPADTKLAYALDIQALLDSSIDARKGILASLNDRSKNGVYNQLEVLGNLRVDRIMLGFVDAEKPDAQKIFIRITGLGNQAWVAQSLIEQTGGQLEMKKSKEDDGTPIITLHNRNAGPIFVLIGNTDLVVAGYKRHDGRHEEVIAQLLALRAKAKPHAGTGALKDRLAKIPDQAIGFLVGDLPADLKKEIGGVLDPLPTKFAAHLERDAMGLALKAEVVMKDGAEANRFVAKVGGLRKDGIAFLQQALKAPPQPGMPPPPFFSFIKALETIQAENQGEHVRLNGFVSSNLLEQLGTWLVVYSNQIQLDELPKNGK